jgi:glycosyltransferase involved in cell wall biosynthesis
MKKKLTYVVSDIDKSLHFEWIASGLSSEFLLTFILIGPAESALERYLKAKQIPVHVFAYRKKLDVLGLWLRVLKLFRDTRPDIIHTHLWMANLVGLSAAYFAGVKKRIYTRHHATIHHTQHRSGLKWDIFNNRMATNIIAISRNVKDLLTEWDKADPVKVVLIHHGFCLSYFATPGQEKINALRAKYGLNTHDGPVIGVISRLVQWKGVQYIIPAFAKLQSVFPNAHLVLANAYGDYENAIDGLLTALPEASYTKIRFEADLAALYSLFDIFVHVPTDPHAEAFGQTYVEALMAGVPSVFTLSGIAPEVVRSEENAIVVGFQNSDEIYRAMMRILTDATLKARLIGNGKTSVQSFTMENHLHHLKNLYLSES